MTSGDQQSIVRVYRDPVSVVIVVLLFFNPNDPGAIATKAGIQIIEATFKAF